MLCPQALQATRNGNDLWLSRWVSHTPGDTPPAAVQQGSQLWQQRQQQQQHKQQQGLHQRPERLNMGPAAHPATPAVNSWWCGASNRAGVPMPACAVVASRGSIWSSSSSSSGDSGSKVGRQPLDPTVRFYLTGLLVIAAVNSVITLVRAFSFAKGGLVAAQVGPGEGCGESPPVGVLLPEKVISCVPFQSACGADMWRLVPSQHAAYCQGPTHQHVPNRLSRRGCTSSCWLRCWACRWPSLMPRHLGASSTASLQTLVRSAAAAPDRFGGVRHCSAPSHCLVLFRCLLQDLSGCTGHQLSLHPAGMCTHPYVCTIHCSCVRSHCGRLLALHLEPYICSPIRIDWMPCWSVCLAATVDDSLPFIMNILLAYCFSLAGIAAVLCLTQVGRRHVAPSSANALHTGAWCRRIQAPWSSNARVHVSTKRVLDSRFPSLPCCPAAAGAGAAATPCHRLSPAAAVLQVKLGRVPEQHACWDEDCCQQPVGQQHMCGWGPVLWCNSVFPLLFHLFAGPPAGSCGGWTPLPSRPSTPLSQVRAYTAFFRHVSIVSNVSTLHTAFSGTLGYAGESARMSCNS